jgi:hypothetical protein
VRHFAYGVRRGSTLKISGIWMAGKFKAPAISAVVQRIGQYFVRGEDLA